jgi:hypothetical protein
MANWPTTGSSAAPTNFRNSSSSSQTNVEGQPAPVKIRCLESKTNDRFTPTKRKTLMSILDSTNLAIDFLFCVIDPVSRGSAKMTAPPACPTCNATPQP